MKTYKQAKIPAGSVEVRIRGSIEDGTGLTFKRIVPTVIAMQGLMFMVQYPAVKKPRSKSSLNKK